MRVIGGEGEKAEGRKEERRKGGVKYAEREGGGGGGGGDETRVALTNVPHTTERDREEWPKLQRDDEEDRGEEDGTQRGGRQDCTWTRYLRHVKLKVASSCDHVTLV